MFSFRIGHGYDAHRFAENRALVLGGAVIPHTHGLDGHSDADVLTHAVMDALLGAAALGDIGKLFPDTDARYKGISSLVLLAETARVLQEAGYSVSNLDATIVAQAPRLASYIPEMRRHIAETLGIGADQVSVKATTEEHMGFTGRKEGIAAHCVALVYKR